MVNAFKKKIKDSFNNFKEEFITFIKNVFLISKTNLLQVVIFTVYCAVFTMIITSLLRTLLLSIIMGISNVDYITQENLSTVIGNPNSLIVVIIFLIIITFMSIFEIAGLLHAFTMAQVGRKTNIYSMVAIGAKTCIRVFSPRNWLLVLFIIVLFPLARFLPLSSSTFKLILPGFVYQTIDYTRLYSILYKIGYFILILLISAYIFAINIFVLRQKDFIISCKESRRLGKRNYFKIFITILLLTIFMNFTINSTASVIIINIRELISMFQKNTGIVTKSSQIGMYTYVLRQIMKSIFSPMINNAAFTALYFQYVEKKYPISTLSSDIFKERKTPKWLMIAFNSFSLFTLLISGAILGIVYYALDHDPITVPLVCAHRGDNVNAPENTLPAFQLAASESIPWIELDVHQTSDNVIVCNHDSNIKRVTGQDMTIHDHTYDELVQHKIGDWMPGNYEDVYIPKLEEALLLAKENNMNVQVELKGHRDDINFEENVLKVINDTGMHDKVMIISMNANRIRRINQLDPSITKAYCMFVAIGSIQDIDFTDNVSIEESNITPELVWTLHQYGKKVFCWTVDNQDTLQYLVSCNVDVIGTDNPTLILSGLENADYSNGLNRMFHVWMNTLASMDK